MKINFRKDDTPVIVFEHPAEKIAFTSWLTDSLGGGKLVLDYVVRTKNNNRKGGKDYMDREVLDLQ